MLTMSSHYDSAATALGPLPLAAAQYSKLQLQPMDGEPGANENLTLVLQGLILPIAQHTHIYSVLSGALAITFVLLLWFYVFLVVLWPQQKCNCCGRLDGKIVVITGGTDGVGKETAFELARRGARIILPSRNIPKAIQVVDAIKRATGNPLISYCYVDFIDLQSVDSCAEYLLRTLPRIDILVNNAGIGHGVGRTRDGIPLLFGVNHLGPFHLTSKTLPLLRRSGKARIVFVSSVAHLWGKIDLDRIETADSGLLGSQFRGYSRSKLAQVLFARQLHHNEAKHGITTFVAHPGWTFTSIFRDFPRLLKIVVFPLFHLFLYLPWEGAQTQIHLTLATGIEGQSGQYFESCRQAKSSQWADDRRLADDLSFYCHRAVANALKRKSYSRVADGA